MQAAPLSPLFFLKYSKQSRHRQVDILILYKKIAIASLIYAVCFAMLITNYFVTLSFN
jgi:hypothetical protein